MDLVDTFLHEVNYIVGFLSSLIPESPAFEVLPSLKRLKQRIIAVGRGQYDAVFMSGRYGFPYIVKSYNLVSNSSTYNLYF